MKPLLKRTAALISGMYGNKLPTKLVKSDHPTPKG